MAYYNSQEGEDLPSEVGKASSTIDLPFLMASSDRLQVDSTGFLIPSPQVDSHGFPVPPPLVDGHGFPISAQPVTSSPVTRSVYQPLYQQIDRTRISTPPRTKSFEKIPGTPETISSWQEERGVAKFPILSNKDDREENSNSLMSGGRSGDSLQSNFHDNLIDDRKKKEWWFFQTKYAMVIILLMLLLIGAMVAAYFLLPEEQGDNIVNSIQSSDGSSLNPVASAPSVSTWPVASPSRPPTPRPTRYPTRRPTPTPTTTLEAPIREFLFQDNDINVEDTNPVVQRAVAWLVEEAGDAKSLVFPLDQKYLQRFGVLILFFSVDPIVEARTNSDNIVRLPNFFMRNHDECSWIGIQCDENGLVTKIKLSNLLLDGTLPAEWGFFRNLKSIDFSNNDLQGSIPEGMYDILGLEELHLYKNQLTGTISSKIGNLWSLRRFHLNNNRLSGSIPAELRSSGAKIRPLRSFNVHRNQMTGTIPSNMRLRQLYYMDLGHNQFSGMLPPDLGTESVRLRHLYLDHNNFEGSFPSEVLNAGNGRLRALTLNNNNFSGAFPDEHQLSNSIMVELTIQNNNFVSMGANTCFLDLWSGGKLVEFKSDCSICRCGDTYLCENCQA